MSKWQTGLFSESQTGEEMDMGLRDDCRASLSHRRGLIPPLLSTVPTVLFVYLCLLFPGLAQTNEISESCVCVCAEMLSDSDSVWMRFLWHSGVFWWILGTRLGLWIGMLGGLNEWQKSFTDDTYEWRIAWERWQGECVMKCFSWCGWGYICSGCVWPHLIVNRLVCVWSMLN